MNGAKKGTMAIRSTISTAFLLAVTACIAVVGARAHAGQKEDTLRRLTEPEELLDGTTLHHVDCTPYESPAFYYDSFTIPSLSVSRRKEIAALATESPELLTLAIERLGAVGYYPAKAQVVEKALLEDAINRHPEIDVLISDLIVRADLTVPEHARFVAAVAGAGPVTKGMRRSESAAERKYKTAMTLSGTLPEGAWRTLSVEALHVLHRALPEFERAFVGRLHAAERLTAAETAFVASLSFPKSSRTDEDRQIHLAKAEKWRGRIASSGTFVRMQVLDFLFQLHTGPGAAEILKDALRSLGALSRDEQYWLVHQMRRSDAAETAIKECGQIRLRVYFLAPFYPCSEALAGLTSLAE